MGNPRVHPDWLHDAHRRRMPVAWQALQTKPVHGSTDGRSTRAAKFNRSHPGRRRCYYYCFYLTGALVILEVRGPFVVLNGVPL